MIRSAANPGLTGRLLALTGILLLLPAVALTAGKALSPPTWKQLTAIHAQIERHEYPAARKALNKLLANVGQHSYDRAVVLQTLGFVYINEESWPAAIRAFRDSLALQQLPDDVQQRVRYDLAQLYLAGNQPREATSLLEQWFEQAPDPSAEAWLLLGHGYAQQKRYRKAVAPLKHALETADQPPADWYETLLAVYYELKSWPASLSLLEDMIRHFPDRNQYWRQLAGVHQTLGNHDAALAVLELAYRDGALSSEQDLLQLARLYIFTGVPYPAARLIEHGMQTGGIRETGENQELLARAWTASRERKQAIATLEIMLRKGAKPDLRLQLAQWYVEEQRWPEAERVLLPLTHDRDSPKTAATAWLLLGIARFEQGKASAAKDAFQHAGQYPDQADDAKQWLDYIGSGVPEHPDRTRQG